MSLLIVLGLGLQLAQAAPLSTGSITGQVVEATTALPIADAQVTLLPLVRTGRTDAPPVFDRPITTRTDRDGRYRFDRVSPGRYRVQVQKAGFAPPEPASVGEVRVVAEQAAQIAPISLPRGAVIAGRVIDAAGAPVADARVLTMRRLPERAVGPTRVDPRPAAAPPMFIATGSGAQSNDIGEFRVFGLPAGEYIVAVQGRDDFGGASHASVVSIPTYFPDATDPAAAQPIALTAGQTYGDVVIRIAEAPAFHISGIVRGANGRAIANALVRVSAEPQTAVPALMFLNRMEQQAHTDAAGRFFVGGIVNGTYTLVAIAPEVLTQSRPESGSAGGASWGVAGGVISGTVSGGGTREVVLTETHDGITTRYRETAGTRTTITIADAHVDNLELVVGPER